MGFTIHADARDEGIEGSRHRGIEHSRYRNPCEKKEKGKGKGEGSKSEGSRMSEMSEIPEIPEGSQVRLCVTLIEFS